MSGFFKLLREFHVNNRTFESYKNIFSAFPVVNYFDNFSKQNTPKFQMFI